MNTKANIPAEALRYGQTVTEMEPGVCVVSGKCFVTGKEHTIHVRTAELVCWLRDLELIQDAMPTATEEQREFLMSGTSPEGWEQMFPPEEEDPPELDDHWGISEYPPVDRADEAEPF